MKPLVVIPARGGSKGVPRKNIKLLNSKPLIYYTLEAARAVFRDEIIYVSTDDEEIKVCVEKTGLKVPFLRPVELATDTAGSHEVMLHAVSFAESTGYFPDTLILLQPTSPFRMASQIEESLSLMDNNTEMVVSVKETRANPYYVLFEEDSHGYLQKSKPGNFTRRQDCPPVWELNGAIYIIDILNLKASTLGMFTKVKKYIMNDISSFDIDTLMDWQMAEILAAKGLNK